MPLVASREDDCVTQRPRKRPAHRLGFSGPLKGGQGTAESGKARDITDRNLHRGGHEQGGLNGESDSGGPGLNRSSDAAAQAACRGTQAAPILACVSLSPATIPSAGYSALGRCDHRAGYGYGEAQRLDLWLPLLRRTVARGLMAFSDATRLEWERGAAGRGAATRRHLFPRAAQVPGRQAWTPRASAVWRNTARWTAPGRRHELREEGERTLQRDWTADVRALGWPGRRRDASDRTGQHRMR